MNYLRIFQIGVYLLVFALLEVVNSEKLVLTDHVTNTSDIIRNLQKRNDLGSIMNSLIVNPNILNYGKDYREGLWLLKLLMTRFNIQKEDAVSAQEAAIQSVPSLINSYQRNKEELLYQIMKDVNRAPKPYSIWGSPPNEALMAVILSSVKTTANQYRYIQSYSAICTQLLRILDASNAYLAFRILLGTPYFRTIGVPSSPQPAAWAEELDNQLEIQAPGVKAALDNSLPLIIFIEIWTQTLMTLKSSSKMFVEILGTWIEYGADSNSMKRMILAMLIRHQKVIIKIHDDPILLKEFLSFKWQGFYDSRPGQFSSDVRATKFIEIAPHRTKNSGKIPFF